MKIVVMNNSGNVGKTTVVQQMLKPRFPTSEIIRVETLNDDGESTGQKLGANEFDEIFESILINDNVIVDIGASNIESFSRKLEKEFNHAHVFIDYFIIPVTPEDKQQTDTVATFNSLTQMGVDPEKIKIVFNRQNPSIDFYKQFKKTIDMLPFSPKGDNAINDTSFFKSLKKAGISYDEIEEIDRKALEEEIKNCEDKSKKSSLQIMLFYKMGYDTYQANLQKVFDSLELI